MSWFESIEQAFDIDITSIQDTISSQLQEASNFSEFLNLDALEQQHEQEENDDDDDDDYDNDEFIAIKNDYYDNIRINNNINTITTKDDNIINKKNTSNDITTSNTNNDPAWDWTPVKVSNNDNNDITNSAQSDRLSVVDLENSPMAIHDHYNDNKKGNTTTTTTTTITNNNNAHYIY